MHQGTTEQATSVSETDRALAAEGMAGERTRFADAASELSPQTAAISPVAPAGSPSAAMTGEAFWL